SVIDAGAGNDFVTVGGGTNWVRGGAGRDVLVGGDGVDMLDGGGGNDLLVGGLGADLLDGGSGNDPLFDGPRPRTGPLTDSLANVLAAYVPSRRVSLLGITARLVVTFDQTAADVIIGGVGRDWFWTDDPLDVLDRLPMEPHNAIT